MKKEQEKINYKLIAKKSAENLIDRSLNELAKKLKKELVVKYDKLTDVYIVRSKVVMEERYSRLDLKGLSKLQELKSNEKRKSNSN